MADCGIFDESGFLAFDVDFLTIDTSLNNYSSSNTIITAKSRLTSILDKPLLNALVQAMVTPIVDIELRACEMLNERWIDTAIGKQLDGCGYIVGEARQGRADDEYREAIRFRIFINTSNGTPNDLIEALRFITKATDLQYIEQYPATSMLFTNGVVLPRDIAPVMQGLAPVAIGDLPIFVNYARNTPFRFSRENPAAELFIDDDANYLTLDGSDWQLSSDEATTGARFSGLVADELFLDDGSYLELDGGIWAINEPENSVLQDSGFHLTGLFTV